MDDSISTNNLLSRSIDLAPEDWHWVTYRERTPLPRPDPKPFDQKEAAARLAKVKTSRYGWEWQWSIPDIAVALSREEALFWFAVMTAVTADSFNSLSASDRKKLPRQLAARLAKQPFEDVLGLKRDVKGGLPLSSIEDRLLQSSRFVGPEIVLPLYNLLSLQDLVTLTRSVRRS